MQVRNDGGIKLVLILKHQFFICNRLTEGPSTADDGTLCTSTAAEKYWLRGLS